MLNLILTAAAGGAAGILTTILPFVGRRGRGIVGRVVHIKDDLVTIETSEDRVRIQITRWAISTKGTQTAENS